MFVYEWPTLIDVAVIADLVFSDRRAHLMRPLSAVRVMAIGALDEPFVHAMAKRHRELRPLLLMAPIAELRLRPHQQEFPRFRMVCRMARSAGDIVPGMQRIDDVQLLGATRMAAQALGVDRFRSCLCEKEQL
jgi:hypothetical protein